MLGWNIDLKIKFCNSKYHLQFVGQSLIMVITLKVSFTKKCNKHKNLVNFMFINILLSSAIIGLYDLNNILVLAKTFALNDILFLLIFFKPSN